MTARTETTASSFSPKRSSERTMVCESQKVRPLATMPSNAAADDAVADAQVLRPAQAGEQGGENDDGLEALPRDDGKGGEGDGGGRERNLEQGHAGIEVFQGGFVGGDELAHGCAAVEQRLDARGALPVEKLRSVLIESSGLRGRTRASISESKDV